MSVSRLALRLRSCVPLAALAVLVFSGTASAEAIHGDFSSQESGIGTDFSSCTGLSGIVTYSNSTVGRFVDTGGTVHFQGILTQDYRIDWSDGTYQLSHSPMHFEGNSNSLGQFVFTQVQQDRGIMYSPDGQIIGRITVFTQFHITWKDTNGNGQPDPDEITANVNQFRVNCA